MRTLEVEVSGPGSGRESALRAIVSGRPGLALRGRGFIWAIDFTEAGGPAAAAQAARLAFDNGLVIERCGRSDVALKVLPPITIEDAQLQLGLDILAGACAG